MKATVTVRLKSEVLDPQGEAVRRALTSMGFEGVVGVRIGKLIELEIDTTADAETLRAQLEQLADELLANPVIEDYEIALR